MSKWPAWGCRDTGPGTIPPHKAVFRTGRGILDTPGAALRTGGAGFAPSAINVKSPVAKPATTVFTLATTVFALTTTVSRPATTVFTLTTTVSGPATTVFALTTTVSEPATTVFTLTTTVSGPAATVFTLITPVAKLAPPLAGAETAGRIPATIRPPAQHPASMPDVERGVLAKPKPQERLSGAASMRPGGHAARLTPDCGKVKGAGVNCCLLPTWLRRGYRPPC